jgi:hypothetical protein
MKRKYCFDFLQGDPDAGQYHMACDSGTAVLKAGSEPPSGAYDRRLPT